MADVLRRRLAPGDPFEAYPDLLAALPHQRLRGYLVGSLDAVLRFRDHPAGRTYRATLVADYKTNWLGDAWPGSGEPLTAWHYRPEALTEAMLSAHYPLQALLYLVALHRYLGWRQPGYDPDTHLGGVLYLFVRGMCGPATPVVDGVPCGVFGWRPPSGLVHGALTLAGGRCSVTTEQTEVDPFDARIALRAPGLLAVFNAAGVLSAADVHVALRLGRLGDESDERVLLAAALAVRAVRLGSVCVALADVRETAAADEESTVDLDALPWPDADPWQDGGGGEPARRARPVG